ncbi:protein-disulfide reductase DsbD domain-containing protein [Ciceribacter naphthalenivorans]|uniref:protein-disulfide reductase DsbD domain-containing protein n=1 Tax=Ciceribacter naphthalenivorans TaxID=1118451 RepID=UPI0011BE6879|nr:protein-disulfide reductase DsbD domain-containing protein [Ciceribacter naphthalenivorans]
MRTVRANFRRPGLALAALAAALMGQTCAAWAESSDWAVNQGGRMRLVVLPADAQGTRAAALQIEPSPGWITYWREPGDAGIPPSITIAPESGYALTEVAYPVPKRIDNGDIHDIGYDAPVTLPLTLVASGAGTSSPGEINASVFIGLCRNICIPFQAELRLTPNDAEEAEETALIVAARARLPEPPAADFALKAHALSADGKHLSLTLTVPTQTKERDAEIFVTGPSGHVFLDESERKLSGDELTVVLPISGLPRKYDIHGKTWGVLVKAGGRAMETHLAFD